MNPRIEKQFLAKSVLLALFTLTFVISSYDIYGQVQTQTPISIRLSENIGGYYESLPVDYNSNPGKKYPMILFFHGKGEKGNGSLSQLPRVAAHGPAELIKKGLFPSYFTVNGQTFSFIVISPQINADETINKSEIGAMIDYMMNKYRVDEDRVYITGLSMGGGITMGTLIKYPQRFAAVLSVCGSSIPKENKIGYVTNAHVPIWFTHNIGDPTVPAKRSQGWYDSLISRNADPKPILTLFNAKSHDAWTKTYDLNFKENGLNVYEWMLTHKRGGSETSLPPVANAGTNQTITLPTNSVMLDGTKSTAPAGSIVSYSWSKVSGPSSGTISSPTSSKSTVINLKEGTYQFQLKIIDNKGSSATSIVTVKVNPAPLPPIADAGNTQIITLPKNTITLDGTKSTAPSGIITGYLWSKISGPSGAKITTATAAQTSITDLVEGDYIFQLKVTDNHGGTSSASVNISVKAAPMPPIANAGDDQTIDLPVNSIVLDGSASFAPSGTITTYAWSKVSGPSGEQIVNSAGASTTINNLIKGIYQFQLKVIDNNGASAISTVTITVNAAPLPPVADAGEPQAIRLPENEVVLDGKSSYTPEGFISSYKWRKVSGPLSGELVNATDSVAKATGLTEGIYKFELEVTNSKGLSATSLVTVTVNPAFLPPIANAGPDKIIILPEHSVTLNGKNSIAPSGNIKSYSWSKVSGPEGEAIESDQNPVTTVTNLVEGVYVFNLVVTDNNGLSASSNVSITVKAAPLPPVADAGPDQTITLPTNHIILNGSSSFAGSGTIESYAWSKESGPAGSSIESSGEPVTAVSNLTEGVYVFTLTVTNTNGLSSASTITITVKPAPLPPVADAGIPQAIVLPVSSVVLNGSGSNAPSGTIETYKWVKLSGPSGEVINSPSSASTTVSHLVEGIYVFELNVTDNNGNSSTATVAITVNPAVLPPIANAGSDQLITLPANSVTLDGNASIAPSGTITHYEWSRTSGPVAGKISDPQSPSTTVTELGEGIYLFELKVTDDNGNSAVSTVTVTVKAPLLPPIADAGIDQTLSLPVDSVTLDGTGSIGQSGKIDIYQWTKLDGPAESGIIQDEQSVTTLVNNLIEGLYRFELEVTDENGLSSKSIVTVTVNATLLPPVANAGVPQTITLPVNSVTLDGSASVAQSGNLSSYQWSKVSGPGGNSIVDPSAVITTVTDLEEGLYKFQLMVVDDNGNSSTSSVNVVVKPAPLPPIADAGLSRVITLPVDSVMLSGNNSAAGSGTIIGYEWKKISGPAEGIIISPEAVNTAVVGLEEGVYVFELTVADNNNNHATASVTITVNPALLPPVANAGAEQLIRLPVNSITLDASASLAPSGVITSYVWSKLSGPTGAVIIDPSAIITKVNSLGEGVHLFELAVTDNNGNVSRDTISITVEEALIPPVSAAGVDQEIILPANSVILNGSGSTAPSGVIEEYIWSKKSGPAGGIIVSEDDAVTAVSDLEEGEYIFELKVTDNNGNNSTSSVSITVKAAPLPPIANAGSDQEVVMPVTMVTLDGSASNAPSGVIAEYIWSKVSGSDGEIIEAANEAVTKVTNLEEGEYVFRLKVTDNNGLSSTSNVIVRVKAAPMPPLAVAGDEQTITLPQNSAVLDGSASSMVQGNIISYEWSKVSGPTGMTILSPDNAITHIIGLREGEYLFELRITAENGLSSVDNVKVIVTAAPEPPVANAGLAMSIMLPEDSVLLDGGNSSASEGNAIVSYQWTKVSGPEGEVFSNSNGESTWVSGLVAGAYQFKLEVVDNNGRDAAATVNVTVNAAPPPPVAVAGNNVVITLPVDSVVLDGTKSQAPGSSIESYQWSKVSGPKGGNLTSPTNATTIVKGLTEGKYQYRLTVTDNNGQSATAIVTITVKAAPLPPVANASGTQTITLPTNTVTLDGSGSSAPSGQIIAYKWDKISGPSAGIIVQHAEAVTTVKDLVAGTYIFQLTVADDKGGSSTASVTVVVNPEPVIPPVANAGDEVSFQLPVDKVVLDGSASYALRGKIEHYKWEQLSGPDGIVILNSDSKTPTLRNLKPGVYEFKLIVEDSNGVLDSDIVKVTIISEAVVLPPPVANAGGNRTIELTTEEVYLDGGLSYAQFGNIEKYSWELISGPTAVRIDNAETDLALVSGMGTGDYLFKLKVTDNTGKTDEATVKISVVNAVARLDLSPVAKVFPNPVNTHASIELQGPAKGRTVINMYNASGKVVYSTEFIKDNIFVNHEIDVSRLSRGVYIIEVVIDYQYKSVMKLMKL